MWTCGYCRNKILGLPSCSCCYYFQGQACQPFAGFFAKFAVIRLLVQSHHYGLAGFSMLMAIVGAYYL
jgi:hypothetical protein